MLANNLGRFPQFFVCFFVNAFRNGQSGGFLSGTILATSDGTGAFVEKILPITASDSITHCFGTKKFRTFSYFSLWAPDTLENAHTIKDIIPEPFPSLFPLL
jgi:hypothetical protein